MKIDDLDMELLSTMDNNCRIPISALSLKLGKSRQTIEKRIKKLEQSGIIQGYSTVVNPSALGYRLYKMYLKLRHSPEEREQLKEELFDSGNVYWIGEVSGYWDVLVGILFKDEEELFDLTNRLTVKHNQIIVEHQGHMVVDIQYFPKFHLYFDKKAEQTTSQSPKNKSHYGGSQEPVSLDKVDLKILAMLVNDAKISLSELSINCNVSLMTAKRKLENLVEKNVIQQFRIGLDFRKIGFQHFKTLISINQYSKSTEQKLLKYLSTIPGILYYLRNIWQIEIEFMVKDFSEYQSILNGINREFPKLSRTIDSLTLVSDSWKPGIEKLIRRM